MKRSAGITEVFWRASGFIGVSLAIAATLVSCSRESLTQDTTHLTSSNAPPTATHGGSPTNPSVRRVESADEAWALAIARQFIRTNRSDAVKYVFYHARKLENDWEVRADSGIPGESLFITISSNGVVTECSGSM